MELFLQDQKSQHQQPEKAALRAGAEQDNLT
jgi:hypothetical protein